MSPYSFLSNKYVYVHMYIYIHVYVYVTPEALLPRKLDLDTCLTPEAKNWTDPNYNDDDDDDRAFTAGASRKDRLHLSMLRLLCASKYIARRAKGTDSSHLAKTGPLECRVPGRIRPPISGSWRRPSSQAASWNE